MYWLATPVPSASSMNPEEEIFVTKATPEQLVAWRQLCLGHNVCILGPGGTGKSQFIRWVKQIYMSSENSVIVTASTANAAFLLGGITLHRFTGLPVWVCDEKKYDLKTAFDKYIKWTSNLVGIVNNIRSVNLWICDEISMLSPRVF